MVSPQLISLGDALYLLLIFAVMGLVVACVGRQFQKRRIHDHNSTEFVKGVRKRLSHDSSVKGSQPDTVQKAKSFQRETPGKVGVEYLLYLPADYDAQSGKRWPLILFLHGADERGTNVWQVAMHGPPKIVREQKDFPFIVVSPQCQPGQSWDNDVLLGLLDEVTASHAVNAKRVYLTGLGLGGYGTWSLGLAYPEKFAAIIPICGGGDPKAIQLDDPRKAVALKSLPIWAFHGAQDNVVRLQESERMVEAMRRMGSQSAKLTVYINAEHDSWTETYDNPELYKWLQQHRI